MKTKATLFDVPYQRWLISNDKAFIKKRRFPPIESTREDEKKRLRNRMSINDMLPIISFGNNNPDYARNRTLALNVLRYLETYAGRRYNEYDLNLSWGELANLYFTHVKDEKTSPICPSYFQFEKISITTYLDKTFEPLLNGEINIWNKSLDALEIWPVDDGEVGYTIISWIIPYPPTLVERSLAYDQADKISFTQLFKELEDNRSMEEKQRVQAEKKAMQGKVNVPIQMELFSQDAQFTEPMLKSA